MVSDFCVTPRWLEVQITLNRKVNSERDYLAPQLLFPQKPSSSLSRTHRSEVYPLCKNGTTNPFNRDTEDLPKNVLFTILRLNRKCTAFPQDSENGFPMSGGMQSGACFFLAVNICQSVEPKRSREQRQEGLPSITTHPCHHLNAARARKVLKIKLNVVVRQISRGNR